jgi:hypothetical protein
MQMNVVKLRFRRAGYRISRNDDARNRHRRQRRGTSYVFFLGTAMLVTIIGLSALTVVRVKVQAAEGGNDAAKAMLYAQSAIEHGLLAIYTDTSWRDSITHDAWQPTQPIGDGSFTWRLVDEANLSFTADRNAPVRLHGQGVCGESVWIYSVLVQPPLEDLPTNVLTNGDLETGLVDPWWETGDCGLKLDDYLKHSGVYALLIWQRGSMTAAARQTIATLIHSGTRCQVNAWVCTRSEPETIKVGAWVRLETGWEYFPIGELAATTTWQAVQGSFTPTWTGTLLDAYLEIGGTTSYQEFAVDDVSLVTVPGAVGPKAGTWRREVQ